MRDAPDVDAVDGQDPIRKMTKRPGCGIGKVRFVRMPYRSGHGMTRDMPIGMVQSVDETERDLLAGHADMMADGFLDVRARGGRPA